MNSRIRLLVLSLAIAAVAALTLAACGDDAGGGGGGGDLASVVPADTPVYVQAAVRPEGDLKSEVDALVENVAGINPGDAIVQQIDAGLASEEITYESDIEPWLGENAAVFISGFDGDAEENGAVVVETTDSGAAQDFIDKLSEGEDDVKDEEYEGVSFKSDDEFAVGIVDDVIVAGDPTAFKAAVDASGGDSLEDNSEFSDTIDQAPSGSMADVYVDLDAFFAAVKAQLDPASLQFLGSAEEQLADSTALASLVPTSDQVEIDFRTNAGTDQFESADLTDFIGSFPGGSFAAFATPDVGKQIQQVIDQFDASGIPGQVPPGALKQQLSQIGLDADQLASTIGDIGFFVEGTDLGSLGGAMVITTEDEQAAKELIVSISRLAVQSGATGIRPLGAGRTGFIIRDADTGPKPFVVETGNGRIVFAYGDASAETALSGDSGEPLSGSETFGTATDALGDADLAGFVDFGPILQLADNLGASSDPDYAIARPYLDKLNFMVFGAGEDGDFITSKVILGLTGE